MQVAGNLGTQPGAGQGAAPGVTTGAPAGAQMMGPQTLPPPLPQNQMPTPSGLGAFFRNQQFPAAAGGDNNPLMQQYIALQRLMRGA